MTLAGCERKKRSGSRSTESLLSEFPLSDNEARVADETILNVTGKVNIKGLRNCESYLPK
jgi:hypothetical protein